MTAAFLAAVAFCAPAFAEKKIALVIGNDSYANVPKLRKAVNDAESIGDALQKLGFQVVRGKDLSRQGMIDKLDEFTSRIEPGDTALFFYAGHGVAIGGANFLLPVDVPAASASAEARVRGASVTESDVISEIQGKGARVAILMIDACRDNPFPKSAGRSVGSTRGLADAKPARGVFTMYSAGIGQAALDELEPNDPNRNSVFTRVLIENLNRPGLHLGELAVEVREKVAALAQRNRDERNNPSPHEQTPAYYDQTIGGRVFLAGRGVAVEPTPGVTQAPQVDVEAQRRLQEAQRQAAEAQMRIAALEREAAAARAAEEERRRNAVTTAPTVVPPVQQNNPPPVQSNPVRTARIKSGVSQGIHNMRSGPGTNYALVASVPAGATVRYLGDCRSPADGSSQNRWCRIEWRGQTGYASMGGILLD